MRILNICMLIGITLCFYSKLFSFASPENVQIDPEMELYAKNDYLQKVDLYSELGKYYRDSSWIDRELLDGLNGAPEFRVFLKGSLSYDMSLSLDYDKLNKKYIVKYKIYRKDTTRLFTSEISKKNAALVYRLFKAGIQQSRLDNWPESGGKDGFGYYFIINLDGIKTGYEWSVYFKLRVKTLQRICDNIIDQIRNKVKQIKLDYWTRKQIIDTIKDIEVDKLRIFEW